MFARRVSASVRLEGLEELTGHVVETRATEITQQPGFIGAVVMPNSNADEMVALSFWETEAAMAPRKTPTNSTVASPRPPICWCRRG